MSILQTRLVLAPDVLLIPAGQLTADVFAHMEVAAEDVVVSRPGSRRPSQVISAATADLIRQFSEPTDFTAAVIAYSRARGLHPETLLESALDAVQRLAKQGVLVADGEQDANNVAPSLQRGDSLGEFTVARPVQAFEDTEVYHVTNAAGAGAIAKIRWRHAPPDVDALLSHEAEMLRRAPSHIVPRVLAEGTCDGRSYIVLEWVPGSTAFVGANALRRTRSRARLLRLCERVLHAYAQLHDAGLVHGDVHPRNVIYDGRRAVLLDFAHARSAATPPRPSSRPGIAYFYEPECAAAFVARSALPSATQSGEQYAVAALLTLLLTGRHYLDFALDLETALSQIVHEEPLPFALPGLHDAEDLGAVLQRALSKSAAARYPDMREFHAAFAAVIENVIASERPTVETARRQEELSSAVRRRIATIDAARTLDLTAPTASINFGAAGLAYFCYRLARITGDAGTHSASIAWAERALTLANGSGADAFTHAAYGIDPGRMGALALNHSIAGVHYVRVLVYLQDADFARARAAVRDFTRSAAVEHDGPPDLTTGRAGIVCAAANLLELCTNDGPTRDLLYRFGSGHSAQLREDVARRFDGDGRPQGYLGMAHGSAGFLLADLRWRRALQLDADSTLIAWLHGLASCAVYNGNSASWPRTDDLTGHHAEGWCHGSTGYAILWTLAAETVSREWAALALSAAEDAWLRTSPNAGLCCGMTGQACALAHVARLADADLWLGRARATLADATASLDEGEQDRDSLFQGEPGPVLLQSELAGNVRVSFPVFGAEAP